MQEAQMEKGKEFLLEITSVNDFIRTFKGVDPITGEKLSSQERGFAALMVFLTAVSAGTALKILKNARRGATLMKDVDVAGEVSRIESKVGGVGKASGAGKTSKEVEIINKNGSPLGEFDEIDLNKGIFYEDKTAKGLDVVNPRTGLPTQTPQQFADKQIYHKTVNRIKNLDIADATRPTVNGSQTIPSLEEIKGVKKFVFRLDGNSAELQNAVNQSITKLKSEFPSYTFEVIFGGK